MDCEDRISIIIPCYNVEKYLEECLESIVGQSIGMDRLEVVLVNDKSADSTLDIMMALEERFPEHVLVINCDENHRQGGARNIGLSYASGNYVSFVDGDDWLDAGLYRKVYDKAKEHDCDMVQFRYARMMDGERVSTKNPDYHDKLWDVTTAEDRRGFIRSLQVDFSCTTKLYKRALIDRSGALFPEHVVYEEPLFTYPLKFYGRRYYVIEEELYYYRMNFEGTTINDMQHIGRMYDNVLVQARLWEFMKRTEFFNEFYEDIEYQFVYSCLVETVAFYTKRGYQFPTSVRQRILGMIERECPNYRNNPLCKGVFNLT